MSLMFDSATQKESNEIEEQGINLKTAFGKHYDHERKGNGLRRMLMVLTVC